MKIIKKKIFESVCELNDKKNKILGICLGMQLLCQSSTENVFRFSFVNLKVDKFKKKNFKYPHVGFNNISNNKNMRILKYLPSNLILFWSFLRTSITNKLDLKPLLQIMFENFVSCFKRDNILVLNFILKKVKQMA